MPSLFVRKRNDGDNQAVLATRTWGLNSSARTLIYYDDLLVSALIGNNNSGASPHWNLISPEAIARIDFLNGPFAAAYPGNSIGGVLLITSKMPDHAVCHRQGNGVGHAVEPIRHQGHLCRAASTSAAAGNRDGDLVLAGQRQLSGQLSAAADLHDQWLRFPREHDRNLSRAEQAGRRRPTSSAPARSRIRSRRRAICGSPTMSRRWCRRPIRSESGTTSRPPTRRPI